MSMRVGPHVSNRRRAEPTPGFRRFLPGERCPIARCQRHLESCGIAIELGPVPLIARAGAMTSTLFPATRIAAHLVEVTLMSRWGLAAKNYAAQGGVRAPLSPDGTPGPPTGG